MIKINKKEKPQILKDYAQQWTTEYLEESKKQQKELEEKYNRDTQNIIDENIKQNEVKLLSYKNEKELLIKNNKEKLQELQEKVKDITVKYESLLSENEKNREENIAIKTLNNKLKSDLEETKNLSDMLNKEIVKMKETNQKLKDEVRNKEFEQANLNNKIQKMSALLQKIHKIIPKHKED